MLLHCLTYWTNTENKFAKTKNGRVMLLSKCEKCDSKKSKFIKQQEAGGLLSNSGIKTPLNKIPLVPNTLLFKS